MKAEVIVVAVLVPHAPEHGRPVGASSEPGAVTGRVGHGREPSRRCSRPVLNGGST